MGKKVDLSQKNNKPVYRMNKNTRPIDTNYEESVDNSQQDSGTEIEENLGNNGEYDDYSSYGTEIQNNSNHSMSGLNTKNSSDVDDKKKSIEIRKILKNPVVRKILLMSLPIILGILAIAFILIVIFGGNFTGGSGLATRGYYAMRCSEVTVIFTDKSNGYAVTGTGTYSLEDYVAGVVAAEVGAFRDIEVYKTFALAARTYLLTHDDNCTIESSDRKQVFRDITDRESNSYADLIYQAVEETKGQVILSDNELFSVGYDAFCSIDVDDSYYTIKQQNQKIPRSWVDSQSGIAESWKQGTCAGNHGRGISQWGSYYLSSEQGYTYDELLNYYLGDQNIFISGSYITSIANLEVKDTRDNIQLSIALDTFLANRGDSVDNLNSFIYDSVATNGKGTRAGVVTAAVSLINYLNDNHGVRIPYYWGGNYQQYGVDPNFGNLTSSACSSTNCYYRDGFDCSGFVSWAIKNGGYNIERKTTQGFHDAFARKSCNVSDANCVGQPGDLINSKDCHVQMIVAVDEESGKYYIAESTGRYGLVMQDQNIHSGNCGSKETRIIFMDDFYNNQENVDQNY